jgi:hypothetical protein
MFFLKFGVTFCLLHFLRSLTIKYFSFLITHFSAFHFFFIIPDYYFFFGPCLFQSVQCKSLFFSLLVSMFFRISVTHSLDSHSFIGPVYYFLWSMFYSSFWW